MVSFTGCKNTGPNHLLWKTIMQDRCWKVHISNWVCLFRASFSWFSGLSTVERSIHNAVHCTWGMLLSAWPPLKKKNGKLFWVSAYRFCV